MSTYTLTNESHVMTFANSRLKSMRYRISFKGTDDATLHNMWHTTVHALSNRILVEKEEDVDLLPKPLQHRALIIQEGQDFRQAIASMAVRPDVENDVSTIVFSTRHTSVFWMLDHTLNHSIVLSDNPELAGKTLYISDNVEDLGHLHGQPNTTTIIAEKINGVFRVPDEQFCLESYTLYNGPGSSIQVTI